MKKISLLIVLALFALVLPASAKFAKGHAPTAPHAPKTPGC